MSIPARTAALVGALFLSIYATNAVPADPESPAAVEPSRPVIELGKCRVRLADLKRRVGALEARLKSFTTLPGDFGGIMADLRRRLIEIRQKQAALRLWRKKLRQIAKDLERDRARLKKRPAPTQVKRPPPPSIRGRIASPQKTPAAGLAGWPSRPVDAVFILDASGSMRRYMRFPRIRRFDMARYKIMELAGNLPPGSRLAVRVFGSRTSNRRQDRVRGCRDSIRLVPLSQVNRANLLKVLMKVRPSGWTCIGWSLMRAAKDDLRSVKRAKLIVVVTDGDDQCEFIHGSVAKIISRLRRQGVRVMQIRIGPPGSQAAQNQGFNLAYRHGGIR